MILSIIVPVRMSLLLSTSWNIPCLFGSWFKFFVFTDRILTGSPYKGLHHSVKILNNAKGKIVTKFNTWSGRTVVLPWTTTLTYFTNKNTGCQKKFHFVP